MLKEELKENLGRIARSGAVLVPKNAFVKDPRMSFFQVFISRKTCFSWSLDMGVFRSCGKKTDFTDAADVIPWYLAMFQPIVRSRNRQLREGTGQRTLGCKGLVVQPAAVLRDWSGHLLAKGFQTPRISIDNYWMDDSWDRFDQAKRPFINTV